MIQPHYYNRRQTQNAFKRVVNTGRSIYANTVGGAKNKFAIAAAATKYAIGSTVASAASRTQEKRKVKLSQGVKAGVGSHGGTYSAFYYTPRKVPAAYRKNWKALAKNYYGINTGFRHTQTVGLQGAVIVNTMFTYADVNNISQKINAVQTNKFLIKSCSAETLITNQDSGNVNIVLYDIIARRDLSTSSNLSSPLAAFQNSLADEGGSNSNYQFVGTTPFSSDLFTQFFKVVKMTHLTLGQGQCHTHRVKFNVNSIIDGELIQYNTNGFKGVSCWTMAVTSGMPYNDSTTKTQVSTGSIAIDIVNKRQYSYTWMQDVDTNYSFSNQIAGSFTVSEDIMNEATGTATVDVTA
nr:MAG: capsid protein [Cressdnaviricota sp.]